MKTPDDSEMLIQNPGMTRRDALRGAGALALAATRPLAFGSLLAASGRALAAGGAIEQPLRDSFYDTTATKPVGTFLFEHFIDNFTNTTAQTHTNVSAVFYRSGTNKVNVYRNVQVSDASRTQISDTYYSWGSALSDSTNVHAYGPYGVEQAAVLQTKINPNNQAGGRKLVAVTTSQLINVIEDPGLRNAASATAWHTVQESAFNDAPAYMALNFTLHADLTIQRGGHDVVLKAGDYTKLFVRAASTNGLAYWHYPEVLGNNANLIAAKNAYSAAVAEQVQYSNNGFPAAFAALLGTAGIAFSLSTAAPTPAIIASSTSAAIFGTSTTATYAAKAWEGHAKASLQLATARNNLDAIGQPKLYLFQ